MKVAIYFLISFYCYCINYFDNYAGCCCRKKKEQNNNQNNDQDKDKLLQEKGNFDKGTFIGGTEETKNEETKKEETKKEYNEQELLEKKKEIDLRKHRELENQIKLFDTNINCYISDIDSKVKLLNDSINKITKKDLIEKYLIEIKLFYENFEKNKKEYKKLQGNEINEKKVEDLKRFDSYFCDLEKNLNVIKLNIDKLRQKELKIENQKEKERLQKLEKQKELEEEEKRKKELKEEENRKRVEEVKKQKELEEEVKKQKELEEEVKQQKELEKQQKELEEVKKQKELEKQQKELEEINKKINEFNAAREKLEKEIEEILKYIDTCCKNLQDKFFGLKNEIRTNETWFTDKYNEIESSLNIYIDGYGEIKDSYSEVKGEKLEGTNTLDEYNKSLENFKLIKNKANSLRIKLNTFDESLDAEIKKIEEHKNCQELINENIKENEKNLKGIENYINQLKDKINSNIDILNKDKEEIDNLGNNVDKYLDECRENIFSLQYIEDSMKNKLIDENFITNLKNNLSKWSNNYKELENAIKILNKYLDAKIENKKNDDLKANEGPNIPKNELYKIHNNIQNIEIDNKGEYSYECTNAMHLRVYIYHGTKEAEFEILLKNVGDKKWPDDSKLIIDKNYSDLFTEEVKLDAQKSKEEKSYKVTVKDLEKCKAGEYKIVFSFYAGEKIHGEKVDIHIVIKELYDVNKEINEYIDKINEFRKDYGLSKDEYSNEKLLEALKKKNFDSYDAYVSLYN